MEPQTLIRPVRLFAEAAERRAPLCRSPARTVGGPKAPRRGASPADQVLSVEVTLISQCSSRCHRIRNTVIGRSESGGGDAPFGLQTR